MKFKVAKFGTGRHIILPKDKFDIGQLVEIETPTDRYGPTEERVREIVREELELVKSEY